MLTNPYPGYDQMRESFAAEAERLIDTLVQRAAQGEVVDGVKDLAEPYPLKVFPMRWAWTRRGARTCCCTAT